LLGTLKGGAHGPPITESEKQRKIHNKKEKKKKKKKKRKKRKKTRHPLKGKMPQ